MKAPLDVRRNEAWMLWKFEGSYNQLGCMCAAKICILLH